MYHPQFPVEFPVASLAMVSRVMAVLAAVIAAEVLVNIRGPVEPPGGLRIARKDTIQVDRCAF